MQKIKSFNWSSILKIIKCSLIGLVATLIGIVLFALVLKFVDLNSNIIGYVNDLIKTLSLFLIIGCIKKSMPEKLMIKSIFASLIYAVLTFVVFSILNGQFVFNLSIVYDLIFAVIVSIIITVILNLFGRKNI